MPTRVAPITIPDDFMVFAQRGRPAERHERAEDLRHHLDTWRGQTVSLARLAGDRLDDAALDSEPVQPRAIADAPISADEIVAIDAALPPIVDDWWLRAKGPLR